MRKLVLILILILSLTACGKKEEPIESTEDEGWAVNEVKERTRPEEVATSDVTTASTAEPEITEPVVTYPVDFYNYNVQDDINADIIDSMQTISIDGKLLDMPCTYSELAEQFELFIEEPNKYGSTIIKPVETDEYYKITLNTTPTTGKGVISFEFKTTLDGPQPLKDMKISKIFLDGGSLNNEELFTFSLPNNIHFGSTFKDVTGKENTENKPNIRYTDSNPNNPYNIYYSFVDYGLKTIEILYL